MIINGSTRLKLTQQLDLVDLVVIKGGKVSEGMFICIPFELTLNGDCYCK